MRDTDYITKYTTQYIYLKYKIVYECMQYYTVQYGNMFTIQKIQKYTTNTYNTKIQSYENTQTNMNETMVALIEIGPICDLALPDLRRAPMSERL